MVRRARNGSARDRKSKDVSKIIANILFMDIRGYSSLDDQEVKILIDHAFPKMQNIIKEYNYDYINTWGDAIVIASADIRHIVQIALSLRDFFNSFDWNGHGLSELSARFSLHQGTLWSGTDLFTEGKMIAGQAVNLAARIEPIVVPGQVWASMHFINALKQIKLPLAKSSRIGDVLLPKGAGTEELYVIYRSSEQDPNLKGKEVSICIVKKGGSVLLVHRIDGPPLGWQFPAALIKSSNVAEERAVRAVLDETGVTCIIERKIAERVHPDTNVLCHYYLATWTDGEATNKETIENGAVEWVSPTEALGRFKTDVHPDVRALLEGMKE